MKAWGARRTDGRVLLLLTVLPMAVLIEPAMLEGFFSVLDLRQNGYPALILQSNAVRDGQLPLWNPYLFCGVPWLLGNLLLPPNWLFFVLSGPAALNYSILLEFSIAGVGLYLYARWLGLQPLGAFVGAVSFMFSGVLTARVVHPSLMGATALLPWVILLVDRALTLGAPHRLAAAALAVALQLLQGHPQVPVYTAMALALLVGIRGAEQVRTRRDWTWTYRLTLRLAGVYALGAMLSALQILPFLAQSRFAPRAGTLEFDYVFHSSNGVVDWLLFLFPYLLGSLATNLYAAQPMAGGLAIRMWEHHAYVGILPLALAVVPFLSCGHAAAAERDEGARARRTSLVFLGLLALLGILLAAGKHTPLSSLVYLTPVLGRLREPGRALCLVAFAVSVLAAFGVQCLAAGAKRSGGNQRSGAILGLAALLFLVPLGIVLFAPQLGPALGIPAELLPNLSLTRASAYVPLGLALAGGCVLAWWGLRPQSRRPALAAAVLVVLDMAAFAGPFQSTEDESFYTYQPEVVRILRQDPGPYRKVTFWHGAVATLRNEREALAKGWSMAYGIEDANGDYPLQPRRHLDYLVSPRAKDVSYGFLANPRLLQADSPILSSMNVKYVLIPAALGLRPGAHLRPIFANDSVRLYENQQVLPRAWWARSVRSETDAERVLQAVSASGFHQRGEAIVETDGTPVRSMPRGLPASVEYKDYSLNGHVLETSTQEERFLVLSEMDLPGWHASIDGNETPIYRTNYLFRGIVVPSGRHTIEFVYRPVSVLVGALLTALAMGVAAVCFVRGRTWAPPAVQTEPVPVPPDAKLADSPSRAARNKNRGKRVHQKRSRERGSR